MFDFLQAIDAWIYYQINSALAHPVLDPFFLWITDLHKTPYFKFIAVPFVAFLFIRHYRREGISLFLFLILALSLSDFTGGRIKHLVERQRPQHNLSLQQTQRSVAHGKAFPSNHASNMFAFATYTGIFLPHLRVPLFVLAGAVGYSRIYNGVHYPSDVFAGSIMGTLWGLLVAKLAKQVLNYFRRRKRAE